MDHSGIPQNAWIVYIQSSFINTSLKRFKQSSQVIIHLSNFHLNIRAKQSVVNVKDSVM